MVFFCQNNLIMISFKKIGIGNSWNYVESSSKLLAHSYPASWYFIIFKTKNILYSLGTSRTTASSSWVHTYMISVCMFEIFFGMWNVPIWSLMTERYYIMISTLVLPTAKSDWCRTNSWKEIVIKLFFVTSSDWSQASHESLR